MCTITQQSSGQTLVYTRHCYSAHDIQHVSHLSLSQLAFSLHVLEAASLSAQLSLDTVKLLLSACQLNSAGFDAGPQGIQLAILISYLPLKTVVLAATPIQQALQLPDLTLVDRRPTLSDRVLSALQQSLVCYTLWSCGKRITCNNTGYGTWYNMYSTRPSHV